ncbi:protein translocase subunit SecF [Propionibacterium sp.]|uniref:protein translocase subunit SecF n=1 Tax=Propionibacterium sp. TaxID=1977903 RepID=UPI0039E8E6D1
MSQTDKTTRTEAETPDEITPQSTSFAHRLYTGEFGFDFVGHRRRWYTISAVLLLISVVALFTRGLNLGIDFEGGSVFTAPVSAVSSQTIPEYKQAAANAGVPNLDGTEVTTLGGNSVRVQTRSLSAGEVTTMREALAHAAGTTPEKVNYSLIGPSWGHQITDKALQALIVFLVLVGLMIWVFFREWRMAVSALVALAHDLIVTVGIYALVGFTVTPSTLIGVLTILGYSLYDTVVVFDKVRENTTDITHQKRTFSEAANEAVNQVLVRSINTTLIGILPVLALLIAGVGFLGGEGPLADLGLALLIGMVTGAYSSIFIATPLLAQLREAEPAMKKHAAAVERSRNRTSPKVAVKTSVVTTSEETSLLNETATAVSAESGASSQTGPAEDTRRKPASKPSSRKQPARKPRSQRKK